MAHQRFTVGEVADALRRSAGVITAAATMLEASHGSCTRQTVRNYIGRYPKLRAVLDETVEVNCDIAESKLMLRIAEGDISAIRFYLETRGKHRGYTRRTELTGPQGKPIEVKDADAATRLIARLDQMAERLRAFEGGTLGNGAGGPGAAAGADPGARH